MHWDQESEDQEVQTGWPLLVRKQLQSGHWTEAMMACEQVLETNPHDELAYLLRAMALYRLGRYEAAVDSCDRAIALGRDNAEAWQLLGDSLRQVGRLDEAMAGYDRALALHPQAHLWRDHGDLLAQLQRYEAAIASYDHVLETEPNNYQLWHQRGLLLRKVGRWTEAIASVDRSLDLRPDFYAATRSQLYNYFRAGTLWSALLHGQLNRELYSLFESIVRTKLPALVVLGLMAFAGGYSRTLSLSLVGVMLVIVLLGDWITESRQ